MELEGEESWEPEQRLVARVIVLAIRDVRSPTPDVHEKITRTERVTRALRFFFGPPEDSNLDLFCGYLGIDPEAVRSRVLDIYEERRAHEAGARIWRPLVRAALKARRANQRRWR